MAKLTNLQNLKTDLCKRTDLTPKEKFLLLKEAREQNCKTIRSEITKHYLAEVDKNIIEVNNSLLFLQEECDLSITTLYFTICFKGNELFRLKTDDITQFNG